MFQQTQALFVFISLSFFYSLIILFWHIFVTNGFLLFYFLNGVFLWTVNDWLYFMYDSHALVLLITTIDVHKFYDGDIAMISRHWQGMRPFFYRKAARVNAVVVCFYDRCMSTCWVSWVRGASLNKTSVSASSTSPPARTTTLRRSLQISRNFECVSFLAVLAQWWICGC